MRLTQQSLLPLLNQYPEIRARGVEMPFDIDVLAFGDEEGALCFEVYKHRDEQCLVCPTLLTFQDGQSREHEEVLFSKTGEKITVGRYRWGKGHASRSMFRALLDTETTAWPNPSRHGIRWAW